MGRQKHGYLSSEPSSMGNKSLKNRMPIDAITLVSVLSIISCHFRNFNNRTKTFIISSFLYFFLVNFLLSIWNVSIQRIQCIWVCNGVQVHAFFFCYKLIFFFLIANKNIQSVLCTISTTIPSVCDCALEIECFLRHFDRLKI